MADKVENVDIEAKQKVSFWQKLGLGAVLTGLVAVGVAIAHTAIKEDIEKKKEVRNLSDEELKEKYKFVKNILEFVKIDAIDINAEYIIREYAKRFE